MRNIQQRYRIIWAILYGISYVYFFSKQFQLNCSIEQPVKIFRESKSKSFFIALYRNSEEVFQSDIFEDCIILESSKALDSLMFDSSDLLNLNRFSIFVFLFSLIVLKFSKFLLSLKMPVERRNKAIGHSRDWLRATELNWVLSFILDFETILNNYIH